MANERRGAESAGSENTWELQAGSMRARVVDASITELGERFGAIVSPDDNYLTHGGGVSQAIWSAAGPAVEKEAAAHVGSLRLAQVVVTTAGNLNAEHLLHAVTIDYDENKVLGPAEARLLFGVVLDTAAGLGCRSLATPLLGTGAGRLDVNRFLHAAVDALEERLDFPGPLETLVFAAPGGTSGLVRQVLEKRLGGWVSLRSLADEVSRRFSSREGEENLRRLVYSLSETTADGSELLLVHAFERVLDELVSTASESGAGEDEADAGRSRTSLGQKVQAFRERRTKTARPIPPEAHAAFQAAVMARNRIVHGTTGESALRAERGTLLRAIRIAMGLLVEEPGAQGGSAPFALAGPGEAADRPGTAVTLPESPQARGADAADSTLRSGTEHVRDLHAFLLANLEEECRQELLDRLEAEGYRGTPEMRLLEYCVRLEDPSEVLSEWFRPTTLRREAEKATGIAYPPGTRQGALVRALLEHFGFPPSGRPVGLPTVMSSLEASRSEVHRSSLVELKGLVADASARLERALRIVLHFVVRAAFGEPAENVVRKKGWLAEGQDLSRCSLGKLLELVERLDGALRTDPVLDAFRVDFQAKSLFAKGSGTIASYRNGLSHYNADVAAMSLSSARAQALQFFDAALQLLKDLQKRTPSLFPIVIEILEVRIDRFGRRTVQARTDDGRNEVIFTDFPLRPGQVYFMHPLTNPFRVFPVLQPAGDLGTDSGQGPTPRRESGRGTKQE